MKKTGYIFFVPIFSYFILNTEIHRQYVLALLLGYFGAIFVNGVRFYLDISIKDDYPYHLLIALFSLLYSLALVLIKFIMTKSIILSPYIFLFYNGIFSILNSIIITLVQWPMIINFPDNNIKINKSEENDKYLRNNVVQILSILSGQDCKFYIYFILYFIFLIFYYIINTLIFLIILHC